MLSNQPNDSNASTGKAESAVPAQPESTEARAERLAKEVRGLNRNFDRRVAEAKAEAQKAVEAIQLELNRANDLAAERLAELGRQSAEQRKHSEASAKVLGFLVELLNSVEKFIDTQAPALGYKPQKKPKDESTDHIVNRLSRGLLDISELLTAERARHKNRADRLTMLEQKLETDTKTHQNALASKESELQSALQQAAEFRAALELLRTDIATKRSRKDELLEQLLKEQRAVDRKAELIPSKILALPSDKLVLVLEELKFDPNLGTHFYSALVRDPNGPKLFHDAIICLVTAQEKLGNGDGVAESPPFVLLDRAQELLLNGVADQINVSGNLNFILKLDPQHSMRLTELINPDLVKQLVIFAATNPEAVYVLPTDKALSIIDELPAILRAALIECCADDEISLKVLFGTEAIRRGVIELNRLFREKFGTAVLGHSPGSIDAKLHLVGRNIENPNLMRAIRALEAYDLVSQQRKDPLWTKFAGNPGNYREAYDVLGFDLRDAMALKLLKFET